MLFGQPMYDASLLYIGISECGIALALGIPGFLVGAFSSLPSQQAAIALTRQPLASSKIINIMLLTQSLVQTPVIFGFLISLFIKNNSIKHMILQQVCDYLPAVCA